MTLSPAFAEALAGGRPRLNAQVAAARRAQPGFDLDALRRLLADRLDPIVQAVAVAAPEATRAVAEAGFGLAVAMVARNVGGGAAERSWQALGTGLAPVIAVRPTLLGAIANAALRIARTPGARLDDWLARMAALSPQASAETLLPLGQLCAWAAGMAHYRDGALAAGDALPGPLALAALGAADAPGGWGTVRARLAADPWRHPSGDAAPEEHEVGGFAGFGGAFVAIPDLRVRGDAFVLRDGERHLLLVADACGAVLLPASADEFAAAAPGTVAHRDGGVQAGDRIVPLDLPPAGLAAAATRTTLAIVSPYSYGVRVLPWRLP